MNGFSITKCATLCSPEKLTREQLIEQVNYLQQDALEVTMTLSNVKAKLGEMVGVANRLSVQLYALCDSYDEGDQAAILLQVKDLSDRRKKFKKTKVH